MQKHVSLYSTIFYMLKDLMQWHSLRVQGRANALGVNIFRGGKKLQQRIK